MKRQGSQATITGEERVRSDGGSLFKKFFEKAAKPQVINSEVVKSTKKAVATEVRSELNVAVSQIFGIELTSGKAHRLSQKSEQHADKIQTLEQPKMTTEHMSYFAEFKRTTEGNSAKDNNETATIRQQLDAILNELRNLKNSSDELESIFKDVVVDAPPEKPGIYHLTFYEGFLKLVIKMRDKVQDGVTYAKLFKSRKQERSYHSMAKKGGTSYTLHQDRAVATQTG